MEVGSLNLWFWLCSLLISAIHFSSEIAFRNRKAGASSLKRGLSHQKEGLSRSNRDLVHLNRGLIRSLKGSSTARNKNGKQAQKEDSFPAGKKQRSSCHTYISLSAGDLGNGVFGV